MQYTEKLGLRLPEGTDNYDIADMNFNSQTIEDYVGSMKPRNAFTLIDEEISVEDDETVTPIQPYVNPTKVLDTTLTTVVGDQEYTATTFDNKTCRIVLDTAVRTYSGNNWAKLFTQCTTGDYVMDTGGNTGISLIFEEPITLLGFIGWGKSGDSSRTNPINVQIYADNRNTTYNVDKSLMDSLGSVSINIHFSQNSTQGRTISNDKAYTHYYFYIPSVNNSEYLNAFYPFGVLKNDLAYKKNIIIESNKFANLVSDFNVEQDYKEIINVEKLTSIDNIRTISGTANFEDNTATLSGDTGWVNTSGGGYNQMTIEYQKPQIITGLSVTTSQYAEQSPVDFYYSDDGQTWHSAFYYRYQKSGSYSHNFTCDIITKPHKYWKINGYGSSSYKYYSLKLYTTVPTTQEVNSLNKIIINDKD